ncbi:peptidoglycan DD-metalloendopeptidase family protein [Patescibacteria group bacterium]|nr:peptidoglycan DD-metalloendopeptidase family protein [Patescibacteria group bacterium]
MANDYFQPPDGSDDSGVQTAGGPPAFGLGDQASTTDGGPSPLPTTVQEPPVMGEQNPDPSGNPPKFIGANLSQIKDIKQLNLQDFNADQLGEFLLTVDHIFDPKLGLRHDQTAIFKTIRQGQKSFLIFDPKNPQPAQKNRDSYLFPSDLARFLIQTAEKTQLLVLAIEAPNPPTGLTQYQTQNWQYYVRQWGHTLEVKQESDDDVVDELSLLSSVSLSQQETLINLLNQAYSFIQGRQAEVKAGKTGDAEIVIKKPTSDAIIGGGKTSHGPGKPASEETGEAGAETQTQDTTPASETVKTADATVKRQLTKVVSYETAWVYNRLLFELFTKQGIDPDQVDPLLLSGLYRSASHELWKQTPSELARLFASPSARQVALQLVYEAIAQDPKLTSLIYFTYTQFKANQTLNLDVDLDDFEADVPVNFDQQLEDELLNAEDSPDKVFEVQLDELLRQVGGVSDNLSPDVNPLIINAKDQVEFLLRTFGVSPKDLVPDRVFKPDVAVEAVELTRALAVIDSLSIRQLWQTIFPQLDVKKIAGVDIERKRLEIDARFAPFKIKLQALIKSYLKVRASELSLENQTWQADQVPVPEEVAEEVVKEAEAQPKLPPHTLGQLNFISLSSNSRAQEEEDEINSKRSPRLSRRGGEKDAEEDTGGRQKRSGHGFDINHKKLAGYIAQYQRAWEFLPFYVKLVAYEKSGLLDTTPLPKSYTKEKLLELTAPQLDELIRQQGDFLVFHEAVFFRAPLEGVMAEARKLSRRNRDDKGVREDDIVSPQAQTAIREAEIARGDFVLAMAKEQEFEAERQARVQTYIKQLGAQRRAQILAVAKAQVVAQIQEQQATIQAHRVALMIYLAETGQQLAEIEAMEFEAQYQELVSQQQATDGAELGDLSINDIVSADAGLDASQGSQKLSLGERLRRKGAGSANARAQKMMAQVAQKKMGEEVALKMLSQAGWQGKAAAFAIKHRKKIATIWGGTIGGLTAFILGQIMKYGKVALNGAIAGGLGGGIGGAILGAKAGAFVGAFFGGIGAPIGAVIGGVVGGITGLAAGGALGAFGAVKIAQAGGISIGPPLKSAIQTVGQAINPSSPSVLPQTGSAIDPSATSSEMLGRTGGESTTQAGNTLSQTGATPAQAGSTSIQTGTTPAQVSAYNQALRASATNSLASSLAEAAAKAQAAGAWAVGSGIAVSSTLIMVGLMVMTSVYTMYVIFSAFLVPLPVGNSGDRNTSESKYLSLTKVASPTQLENSPSDTTITYTVTVKPKPGYIIEITELSDTFSYQSGAEVNSPPTRNPNLSPLTIGDIIFDPTVADPADYDPMISQIKITQYEVTLSGGTNTQVQNQLSITFNAYAANDPTAKVATETQTTMATVNIGDPQVNCWPVSGTITQLPWGSFSHSNSDAYDIAAPIGSDVRAPFAGTLLPANVNKTTYGPYPVYLRFDVNGQARTLLFGHLVSANVNSTNTAGISVSVGDMIGQVGNGGSSTGPHLHYALVGSSKIGSGLKLKDLIPVRDVNIAIGASIYTCLNR